MKLIFAILLVLTSCRADGPYIREEISLNDAIPGMIQEVNYIYDIDYPQREDGKEQYRMVLSVDLKKLERETHNISSSFLSLMTHVEEHLLDSLPVAGLYIFDNEPTYVREYARLDRAIFPEESLVAKVNFFSSYNSPFSGIESISLGPKSYPFISGFIWSDFKATKKW